jgi:DNA (cytosine-5)-methyltransferase 1
MKRTCMCDPAFSLDQSGIPCYRYVMAIDRSIISLFSGAMGLDLGLEEAGFRTAVAVELNEYAVKTVGLNKPRLPIIDRRIEHVSTREILQTARLKVGEACIVTGGPCCQSFSTVGKRASIGDPRGSLFREFKRVVAESMPRFFVMENVKGILSAAVRHRTLNDRGPGNPPLSADEQLGSALKAILAELAELNYYVVYGLLNCADYGVPQARWRVVFLGSRDGEDIRLPEPTHAKHPDEGKLPWVTLRRAIGSLCEKKPEHLRFTEDRLQLLRMLKAGQNWTHLPARLHKKALGAAYESWGGRVGFCRRLDWDKPSPTLTTTPTGRATTLCHPNKLRPLSVREYAVIQQFPADWKFTGSTQQKHMQIGNAVPVGLGTAIGKAISRTMATSMRHGLPKDSGKRRGQVVCGDKSLEERLRARPKTQLHPPRLLKNSDPKKIREWLEQAA